MSFLPQLPAASASNPAGGWTYGASPVAGVPAAEGSLVPWKPVGTARRPSLAGIIGNVGMLQHMDALSESGSVALNLSACL